jgi:hypothetical protein
MNEAIKYRYFDQIYNVLKLDTFKEMNNNNAYTPMYFNAYDLFKKRINKQMKNKDYISVIITSYNSIKFIKRSF